MQPPSSLPMVQMLCPAGGGLMCVVVSVIMQPSKLQDKSLGADPEGSQEEAAPRKKGEHRGFFLTKAQKAEQAEREALEAAKEASRRALQELQAHKQRMAAVGPPQP